MSTIEITIGDADTSASSRHIAPPNMEFAVSENATHYWVDMYSPIGCQLKISKNSSEGEVITVVLESPVRNPDTRWSDIQHYCLKHIFQQTPVDVLLWAIKTYGESMYRQDQDAKVDQLQGYVKSFLEDHCALPDVGS